MTRLPEVDRDLGNITGEDQDVGALDRGDLGDLELSEPSRDRQGAVVGHAVKGFRPRTPATLADFGHMPETFVAGELLKQDPGLRAGDARARPRRTSDGAGSHATTSPTSRGVDYEHFLAHPQGSAHIPPLKGHDRRGCSPAILQQGRLTLRPRSGVSETCGCVACQRDGTT